MLTTVKKSSISSSDSTFDAKLSLCIIPNKNFQYSSSFPRTSGYDKHHWNLRVIRLLRFLWSCLTKQFALKMGICNVVRVLMKCTFATCKFGPFVAQHQLIDVIASFTTSLIAQLFNRSSSLYAHNYPCMESSFTLFSIVFGIGSLLAMTKVDWWLIVMVCFR